MLRAKRRRQIHDAFDADGIAAPGCWIDNCVRSPGRKCRSPSYLRRDPAVYGPARSTDAARDPVYTAMRYGVDPKTEELVSRFRLEKLIDRRVAGFSGGELRRVSLALAFVGNPKLVFLDEPTTGLDVASQEGFQETAKEYVAQGGALVLTSHHWDEIETVCDTIAFIDQGQMVLTGRMNDMRARANVNRLTFGLPDHATPPAWMQAHFEGSLWSLETADSDTVLRRMVEEATPFQGLTLEPLKLKDLIDSIRREEKLQ